MPHPRIDAVSVGLLFLAMILLVFMAVGPDGDSGDLTQAEFKKIATTGQPLGRTDAPAVLVVFGTYACGFCAKFDRVLDSVRSNRSPALTVVMHSFVTAGRKNQLEWHIAAECAADQGRFSEYRSALFHSPELRDKQAGLLILADLTGIRDKPTFYSCLESQRHLDRVRFDTRLGEELGVDRTPTWFLNGKRFIGAASRAYVDSLVAMTIEGR